MSDLSENIVNYLVAAEPLFEDRIDDLVKRFGQVIPGSTPESKRQTLVTWSEYDPSRNKKFLAWMVQQAVKGVEWDSHSLDHVRDMLNDFEHYITMPAFEAPRDIFQYTYQTLEQTLQKHAGLASKKDLKRGRERLEANVINEVGDLTLIGLRDGASVAAEGWRAYDEQNPNWDGPPHKPTDPEYQGGGEPYSVDRLWCIRNPQRGADYIKWSPSKTFYVAQKKGWPYVGIVLGQQGSQLVDLHNRQISAGMAEEIYDLLKPVLDEHAQKKWDIGHSASALFSKLRIIRGELQPGETISGSDLSSSSLKMLPSDLTVNGDLNVSNTKLTELPTNLTVKGNLIISNTAIKSLPAGLKVDGNMNLSATGISVLPQGLSIGTLDISNTKISVLPSGMQVKDVLNISGTPITKLPPDLIAGKVVYTPAEEGAIGAGLPEQEIRHYFFWRRQKELRANFWKSDKVTGMNDEQKEAAWKVFSPSLLNYFYTSPVIGKAVAAMFEKSKVIRRK